MLFVVNLDSARDRRASMEAQLNALGLSFRRIGIDFRHASDCQIDAWVDTHFPGLAFDHDNVSSAEIGCWASHLCAWRALVDTPGEPACTVLEDDLTLDPALPEAIAKLSAAPAYDVVFLGTSSRNVSSRSRTPAGTFAVHRPIGTIYNTWGYVVARRWVERLLTVRPLCIDRPIDHYTGGARARALKPRIGVLRPAVVREHPELGALSQIAPYTFRIDRARVVEAARRRIIASRVSALYYELYRFL